MQKVQARGMKFLLITSDILVAYASLALAYMLRFKVPFITELFPIPHQAPPLDLYFRPTTLFFILIVWFLVFSLSGLYQYRRGASLFDLSFSIVACVILSTLILLSLSIFERRLDSANIPVTYSRLMIVFFCLTNAILTIGTRFVLSEVLKEIRKSGRNINKVLIVGAGEAGRAVAKKFSLHPELGLEVVGFLDDKIPPETPIDGIKVLASLDRVEPVLKNHQVDQIYIALPYSAHERSLDLLGQLYAQCVEIKIIPDLMQYITLKASVSDLGGIPVVNLLARPMQGWNGVIKRLMDIAISGLALFFLSPLMGLISLLIKIASPGPIFYKQERIGMDGNLFVMYKFRSMIPDAEKMTGPVWTFPDDPRITPFGKFLRCASLDELPQLFNVFKGDMSLVGPRPERPPFVDQFKEKMPRYMLRYRVKSGITGWAQVNGWRGNTSIEKRLEYDIQYIEKWSLFLDLKIIFMTIFYGLVHHNAY